VYVHNTGQQPLRIYVIYANAARFLGTVQPGEGDCFVLPWPTATYNLGAKSLEGEVASPAFQPASAVGWVWDLGMLLRTDAISLGPADAPCR